MLQFYIFSSNFNFSESVFLAEDLIWTVLLLLQLFKQGNGASFDSVKSCCMIGPPFF
ncbi:hypothetical protein R3W88_020758 [Solanum pinnatisectum]|uniref:Uncharacterized protein n=1 Tax=Solanum pinnatisectum TaxID=50273 RepID=A0AAV9KN23_9SOLN|nr:hypothetical protein R3W88_020758 [Solanum pinnatisectum]